MQSRSEIRSHGDGLNAVAFTRADDNANDDVNERGVWCGKRAIEAFEL